MEILNTYSASTVYDQIASLKESDINTIDKEEFRKATSESYDLAASTNQTQANPGQEALENQAQPDPTEATALLRAEDEILNRNANLNKLLINSLQDDINAS